MKNIFASVLLASIFWNAAITPARAQQTPDQQASAPPSPLPGVNATATPTPSGTLMRFSGQILDVRSGFVFFTTGDGFRLDPGYRTIDAATGGPTTIAATTSAYARAAFDPRSGRVVELALSRKQLPAQASYDDVRHFAVALSTPYPNPDLVPPASGDPAGANERYTGRMVLVRFTVQVPPSTPLSEDVYLSTDQSQWDPMAIKLTRIDALHYRIDRPFPSGTKLLYLYTRGSWRTAERDQSGLEEPAHAFVVPESDTKNRSDIIYHWADENQGAPQAFPNAIPTPFNPNPFVTPPRP